MGVCLQTPCAVARRRFSSGCKSHPAKKLNANGKSGEELLALLLRWRGEAIKSGREIKRIAVAFESGRDGFWLARWLRARGIEAYVIRAASTAVSREHRRANAGQVVAEVRTASKMPPAGGWGSSA